MMSKKMIIGIVITAITITLLVAAMAAAQTGSGESDPVLDSLYEQIFELRKEIVERRVELGELTPEEGDFRLEQMEERFRDMTEEGFRPFNGMFGGGWGRDGEQGGRHGHCWR